MSDARMDPDRVRAAATGFDVAADRLDDVQRELERSLQAQGQCWGADEAGQAFAKDYAPNADAMTGSIRSLTDALRSLRAQVQDAANSSQGVDQGSADEFGRLRT